MKQFYFPFGFLVTVLIFGTIITKDILKHKEVMKELEIKLKQSPQTIQNPLAKKASW